MKYKKDIGYVIKRTNYSEADRFITLFTKNGGKSTFLAKGVRKLSSKRSASVEPLNLIQFESIKSGEIYILTQVNLLSSNINRKISLNQINLLFYTAELIDKLCPADEKNVNVFNLLKNFFKAKIGENTLSDFQRSLLTQLGYWDKNKKESNVSKLNEYIEEILNNRIKTYKYIT